MAPCAARSCTADGCTDHPNRPTGASSSSKNGPRQESSRKVPPPLRIQRLALIAKAPSHRHRRPAEQGTREHSPRRGASPSQWRPTRLPPHRSRRIGPVVQIPLSVSRVLDFTTKSSTGTAEGPPPPARVPGGTGPPPPSGVSSLCSLPVSASRDPSAARYWLATRPVTFSVSMRSAMAIYRLG